MKREVYVKFSLTQTGYYTLPVPSHRPAAGLLALSDSLALVKNQQCSEPQSSLMGPKATCLDTILLSQHVKQLGFMVTFVKTVSLCSYCVPALNSRQNTFVMEVLNHLPVRDFKARSSDLKGSD